MKNISKVIIGISLLAGLSLQVHASGEKLYNKCKGCHGASGEKKALGKSEIIKGWDSKKTIKALNGYKDGTYGKAMKGIMKGQVMALSSEDIESIAKYLSTK